jgi:hypothetical protein
MHTVDARRILSDPLQFDDPLRVTAERFLDQLAEAQKLANACQCCCGQGQNGGILCECISKLPDEVTDAFLRGERSSR